MTLHQFPLPAAPNDRARSLAVVIVTYNSGEAISGLLDTLADGLEGVENVDVVIADNASSDLSVAIAKAHPARPRVVQTGWNGGYAAGINAALATVSRHADVLILNPDIRLSPGSVARLVARLRLAHIGIVAPRILHEDGTLVHSLRREPSLRTAWADAVLGARLGARLDRGECICDPRFYEAPGFFDWASGAALAVSAEARMRVGAWDESFFLYSEEVDYQRRVREAGYFVAYAPDTEIVHIGGDYQRNAKLYAILTGNRIRDYGRHHGRFAAAMFRLAVLTGELLRSLGGSRVHWAGVKAALRRPPEHNMRRPPLGKVVGA